MPTASPPGRIRTTFGRRASLVAFVPVAADAAYYALIENGCRTVIRRPERFAKTAVGWILREISKTEAALVRRVVTENIGHFSVESLNSAIKNFHKEERKAYRQLLKDAGSCVELPPS